MPDIFRRGHGGGAISALSGDCFLIQAGLRARTSRWIEVNVVANHGGERRNRRFRRRFGVDVLKCVGIVRHMSLLKNKRIYIFEVEVAHRAVGIGRKRALPSALVPRPGCPTCSSVDSRILSVPLDSRFKREQSECRPQGQSDQHSAESDQLADTFLKALRER